MKTANWTLRSHAGHTIVDAARCPACGHPARIHNVVGCVHASCECVMSRDELTGDSDASATPPAQPSTPPAAAAPAPTDPPATPRDVVEVARDPALAVPAAELVAAPERPRRTQPRTAEGALVDPAGPSGGDADQVVTADRPPSAAVTTYLDQFRACPTGCGWTQERTEFDDEPGLRAARGQHLMSHSAYEITVALEHRAAERDAAYLDPDVLFAHAVWVSTRWYCPACHEWPLDPGACARCKAPLQAVYHATIPREIT